MQGGGQNPEGHRGPEKTSERNLQSYIRRGGGGGISVQVLTTLAEAKLSENTVISLRKDWLKKYMTYKRIQGIS